MPALANLISATPQQQALWFIACVPNRWVPSWPLHTVFQQQPVFRSSSIESVEPQLLQWLWVGMFAWLLMTTI